MLTINPDFPDDVWIYTRVLAGTSPRDFSFEGIPKGTDYNAVVPGVIFDDMGKAVNDHVLVRLDGKLGLTGIPRDKVPAFDLTLLDLVVNYDSTKPYTDGDLAATPNATPEQKAVLKTVAEKFRMTAATAISISDVLPE